MSERHWRLFLEDILECIRKIQEYAANMEFEDFLKDTKTQDAVVRNLEIIGEASKHIPAVIKGKYHEIEWDKIAGLRNRIIHDYLGVDMNIVWEIKEQNLPSLKEQISWILENEK